MFPGKFHLTTFTRHITSRPASDLGVFAWIDSSIRSVGSSLQLLMKGASHSAQPSTHCQPQHSIRTYHHRSLPMQRVMSLQRVRHMPLCLSVCGNPAFSSITSTLPTAPRLLCSRRGHNLICRSAAAVFPPDSNDGLFNSRQIGSWRSPVDPPGVDPAAKSADNTAAAAMSETESEQMKRELHSLNVAIGANILICVAKVWVHLISGSSAMLAEALHSVADILNQVLLRVGVLKAMKAPTAQHPYGYMRDRFVWSLISAVGIFFLGAGASVLHGIHTLAEHRIVEGAFWSYLVLGVSGLLEGYSLYVAARCVAEGAKARGMKFLPYITSGADPTTVAVLLEDGGAVAGLAIAGVCTALTHATGNAAWDAVGSILVGGLLGLIATFLVQKNRDLLLGRSMSPTEIEEVLSHLRRDPVVLYVTDTKTEEIGPGVFRFKAEVAWKGEALVERYLARCGRDGLARRLAAAIEADKHAAAAAAAEESAAQTLGYAIKSAAHASANLDAVLKQYGRDIINVVGAEVDRIESEIQAINPGIRYVDLETDRGRSGGGPGSPAGRASRSPNGFATTSLSSVDDTFHAQGAATTAGYADYSCTIWDNVQPATNGKTAHHQNGTMSPPNRPHTHAATVSNHHHQQQQQQDLHASLSASTSHDSHATHAQQPMTVDAFESSTQQAPVTALPSDGQETNADTQGLEHQKQPAVFKESNTLLSDAQAGIVMR